MNDLQAVLNGSLVSAVLSQQDKRIKVVQAAGLCVFKKTNKKREKIANLIQGNLLGSD